MVKAMHSAKRALPKPGRMLCLSALLLFAGIATPGSQHLRACAMSAMICSESVTLSDFPRQGKAMDYWEYNDPADYLAFVMANSNRYSNNDGYGVVYYQDRDPLLGSGDAWFKRVTANEDFGQVYYTGHYLSPNDVDASCGYDILDRPLNALLDGSARPAIILAHARNASGRTFGNHPFRFEQNGTSYTFMHNGYCGNARGFMIDQITRMHPQSNWFALNPSDYFLDPDPFAWVDSELLFRYIIYQIIANENDAVAGLRVALASLAPYMTATSGAIYNFIMSDGSRLYAFRSTPQSGSGSGYDLSYKSFQGHFYALRTLHPQAGDIELGEGELVVFSRGEGPRHYPQFVWNNLAAFDGGEPWQTERAAPEMQSPNLSIFPNPSREGCKLRIKLPAPSPMLIQVYNLKGQLVWKKESEAQLTGWTEITWDARDKQGARLPAGTYFVTLGAGSQVWRARLALLE